MKTLLLCVMMAFSLTACPQQREPTDPVIDPVEYMKDDFEAFNADCQGGSGDEPETIQACEDRDDVYRELQKKDWCYNEHPNDEGKDWVTCAEWKRLDDAWNNQ